MLVTEGKSIATVSLKEKIEKEFLPFVIKPGRYIGNELGATHKDPEEKVRFCLAFPDAYELGMSYLGMGILYHLINELPYARAERVYAPWVDAGELLRRKNIPLFSLESRTPLKAFDAVGFSISYELTFSNLLSMLDLAGIPILSSRRDEDDPIILAGGTAVVNPEPVADFIDLFVLGDAEEIITKICEIIHRGKQAGLSRREIIEELARLRGVYYPAGYRAEYDENYRFRALVPLHDWLPAKIPVLIVPDLKLNYFPEKPLVPFIEIVHDRLAVEIMRGCVRNCRFCQAGQTYLPRRNRSVDDLVAEAVRGIAASGWDEVTLLSLSSSDYPQIGELARRLVEAFAGKKVALSFPSLRPGTFTMELANLITRTRKTGLTFAPEGGTFRMRWVINKRLRDEELFETCRIAFESGWNLVKLYYMIGLPTETEEDLLGILQMIREVRQIGKKTGPHKQVNVTISPFCPKPHTAFQWERQLDHTEIRAKEQFLRQHSRDRQVALKFRDPFVSYLEGILGRGDRNLGKVVYRAWQKGARFDAWTEHFDYARWQTAFEECGVDPRFYTRELDPNWALPWDHIDKGETRQRLLREREKSLVTTWETVAPFLESPTPGPENAKVSVAPPGEAGESPVSGNGQGTASDLYGRGKKRVRAVVPLQVARSRVRLRWAKGPEVRFISHLDVMRTLERTIRRAELPVAYSEGFHPHMKLAFGPPLPLGFVSDDEYLDLQLTEPYTPALFARLSEQLPPGFTVKNGRSILNKTFSLSQVINAARYAVDFTGDVPPERTDGWPEKITDILAARSWEITRRQTERTSEVDIRPHIYDLKWEKRAETTRINMLVGLGTGGYAKPQEILRFGLGLSEEEIAGLVIRRTNLYVRRQARLDPGQFEWLSPLEVV